MFGRGRSGKRDWDTRGEFFIEIGGLNGEALEDVDGKPMPPCLAKIPGIGDATELIIGFRSKGYHDPGNYDNPPEGDDERTLDKAYLTSSMGQKKYPLNPECAQECFDYYNDRIDEAELPEGRGHDDYDEDAARDAKLDRQDQERSFPQDYSEGRKPLMAALNEAFGQGQHPHSPNFGNDQSPSWNEHDRGQIERDTDEEPKDQTMQTKQHISGKKDNKSPPPYVKSKKPWDAAMQKAGKLAPGSSIHTPTSECDDTYKSTKRKKKKRSPTFEERLSSRLRPDPTIDDLDILLTTSMSPARFDNRQELIAHLTEGSLLNINAMGAKALSIPSGEYVVWTTEGGNTMLVPTTMRPLDPGLYTKTEDTYEILTSKLVDNWNKIERVLAEEQDPDYKTTEKPSTERPRSGIDMSTVDRLPIARALEERGMSETDLASMCGVDVPAISRILREPQDTGGDPGGRNPSMELASKICAALRLDPKSAFPDFFKVNYGHSAREGQKNSGSGKNRGSNSSAFTQGNASEGRTRRNKSITENIEGLTDDPEGRHNPDPSTVIDVKSLLRQPNQDQWAILMQQEGMRAQGTLTVHHQNRVFDGYDWDGDEIDEDTIQTILDLFDTYYS